jgi:hypothetical protein
LAKVEVATWRQVKAAIEAKNGHSLTNAAASSTLNTLVKSSFVVKAEEKYAIADPLMVRGIREDALPE